MVVVGMSGLKLLVVKMSDLKLVVFVGTSGLTHVVVGKMSGLSYVVMMLSPYLY